MTRSRGILPRRRYWSAEEDALLRVAYAYIHTHTIADWLMRSTTTVYQHANILGLKKDAEFVQAQNAELGRKMASAGEPYRYPKGHVPANKGLRRPGWAPGRMRETQFKKGRPAHEAKNYNPIGALRISKDGYLEQKVTDDPNLWPARRWIAVHRLVWQAAHGPIPSGHIVRFKPDMHTIVLEQITLGRLECISRRENMLRNTIHNLPKPLKQVIQLRGALRRQTNKRDRAHEQQP